MKRKSVKKSFSQIISSSLLTSTPPSFMNFTFLVVCLVVLIDSKCSLACKEKPLEQNIENADVIFAGTVRKLERNYSSVHYSALIEIHRIIKGYHLVYDIVYANIDSQRLFVDGQNRPILARRTSANKLVINGHVIYVNNFGSNAICESKVKPNDVRIFLLSMDKQRKLYLNSSLVQPTLTKLRNLNAIVEGSPSSRDIKCIDQFFLRKPNNNFI